MLASPSMSQILSAPAFVVCYFFFLGFFVSFFGLLSFAINRSSLTERL